MKDRELLLGVLATQAGFATSAQVMAAAAARLASGAKRGVLEHLVDSGALSEGRRELLEQLADEALAAAGKDSRPAPASLAGAEALERTFGNGVGPFPVPREASTDIPAERDGQYEIVGELGRGAQSTVWRARDRFIGREVALKQLRLGSGVAPVAATPEGDAALARFLREARLAAHLDHPGIVDVHELVQRPDGTLACAQKLVRGRTLKAALSACTSYQDRLPLLPHLVAACQAIAYAHSQGVMHRDLKPSNIMLAEFGETVVVDWGLAKQRSDAEAPIVLPLAPDGQGLTVGGEALGTPGYMSPEQARGALDEIDERSDVFSLGAILYEVLTGVTPLPASDNPAALRVASSGEFAPVLSLNPRAAPELGAIAEKALSRSPSARYPDAGALVRDLLAYLTGGRVDAYPYTRLELVRKFFGRHPGLTAALGASLPILLIVSVVVTLQLKHSQLSVAALLLERARAAEQRSDWARAAGYYAASRIQQDSEESRWGYALARQRVVPRTFVFRGAPNSHLDLGILPGGEILTIGLEDRTVVARKLEDGHELWRHEASEPLRTAVLLHDHVELIGPDSRTYLDAGTGRIMTRFDSSEEFPCLWGPPSARVRISKSTGLLRVTEGPLASRPPSDVGVRPVCAVSEDGERLAFRDAAGLVHLWNLSSGMELAVRPAGDAAQLLFTAHGLAVVRTRSVDLIAGPEGDFTLDLPVRSGTGARAALGFKSNQVSPDGHLLAIASLTENQADIVDLRSRTLIASVNYPPGRPRFAFTPDGERLMVAGLLSDSAAVGWDLRHPPPLAEDPARGQVIFRPAREGGTFLLLYLNLGGTSSIEVRRSSGELLRTFRFPRVWNAVLSGDGRILAVADPERVTFHSTETGEVLSDFACETCQRIDLSLDGTRCATTSSRRLTVWDVNRKVALWEDSSGAVGPADPVQFAVSGRAIVWARGSRAFIRRIDARETSHLDLDEPIATLALDASDDTLAVVSRGTIGLWSVRTGRPLWRIPNRSWIDSSISWSSDGTKLLVYYESLGTLLLDHRTGERLGMISASGGFDVHENVLPDLKHRLSRSSGAWRLTAFPERDHGSPSQSLRSVLFAAGLELHGVELDDSIQVTSRAP